MCHKSHRRQSKTGQTFQKSNFVRFALCRFVVNRSFTFFILFHLLLLSLSQTDVALMECSDFMQQLRSFKPQSLGSIVARRKSSTTLIFPLPPQACSGKQQTHKTMYTNYRSEKFSLDFHLASSFFLF
jgi:hypothetical protein